MKKLIICIIAVLVLVIGCTACMNFEVTTEQVGSEVTTELTNTEAKKDIGTVAEWQGRTAEILNSEISTGYDGSRVLRVYVNFTNTTDEGLYLYECFAVEAYQDDMAMQNVTDINGDDANTIRAIKNGKSLLCSYAFKLESDSPVEIELHSPTADSILLAKKIYEIEN